MKDVKERQMKIYEYMKQQLASQGYPPTVREICAACGIKSTSTVYTDIKALEEQGLLKKDPSKPRAYMIKGDSTKEKEERIDIVDVPVIGRVAAGTPILAEENIEDSYPVPSRFISKGINFILKVKGESMIEAGIQDGDYILVEEKNTANNGEMVVAMIDGFESEATVKTYYHEGDHIRLQPENSTMSPIIVTDVTILGKVRGVFRYF